MYECLGVDFCRHPGSQRGRCESALPDRFDLFDYSGSVQHIRLSGRGTARAGSVSSHAGRSMMAYIRRGMGQMFSSGIAVPAQTCPAGQQLSFLGNCVDSSGNCTAGGGVFDATTGVCNAPAGGSLYTDQLAAMPPDCPWYCVPWLTYPSTSPCSDCPGVSLSSPGGLPVWAWIGGAGVLAFMLITAVKR
jgi:hypothetical protein